MTDPGSPSPPEPGSAPDPRADGTQPLVWYAAYGSNLWWPRFRTYLEGGPVPYRPVPRDQAGARDPSPPAADRAWWLPHDLFFAGASPGWGGGAVAFLDPSPTTGSIPKPEPGADADPGAPVTTGGDVDEVPDSGTLARIWLITAEQFEDVFRQENGLRVPGSTLAPGSGPDRSVEPEPERWDRTGGGPLFDLARIPAGSHLDAGPQWYGRVLHLGPGPDGHPVATFTGPDPGRHRRGPAHPSYARTVALGLMETWGLDGEQAADRLGRCDGNRGDLDLRALTRDLARDPS